MWNAWLVFRDVLRDDPVPFKEKGKILFPLPLKETRLPNRAQSDGKKNLFSFSLVI